MENNNGHNGSLPAYSTPNSNSELHEILHKLFNNPLLQYTLVLRTEKGQQGALHCLLLNEFCPPFKIFLAPQHTASTAGNIYMLQKAIIKQCLPLLTYKTFFLRSYFMPPPLLSPNLNADGPIGLAIYLYYQ